MNRMMKLRILGASLCILMSGAVSATIMTFDINGTWTQGGSSSDLSSTTLGLGGAGSFTLDPGSSGRYFDFKRPGGGTFSTSGLSIGGYNFLESYAAGEQIGLGNFGDHASVADDWDTILVNDSTAGVWGASHSGYLGFRTAANLYGWIEYDFTRSGLLSTINLKTGAYNDVAGASITAGSVPEPTTVLLMSIGLIGALTGRDARRR